MRSSEEGGVVEGGWRLPDISLFSNSADRRADGILIEENFEVK